ncbi:MAG: aldehyde ferredoxin oxidoreductase family protein [Desulfobacteraceae bacterium]|nr:MAG: aldehyde ferredoxin oxidoreductase family protein [Desulfobacteraceae bacterium]
MQYGWTGINLEIDLSQGNIEKKEGDLESAKTYLGGKGTNAKLLWERVAPEVSPFSPDNALILGTGLLTGTIVPSANRLCITYKSPVTNMHAYSAVGGFLGPEIKYAGYDTVVISGKSPNPVYLWINDNKVEIRDAAHLWGKGTHETQTILREELSNNKVQIACIGPAGENKVLASSIEHSTGASASRGGAGAIMGDKNLKAIAVYGTKDVNIANPQKLSELCEQILKRTGPLREFFENLAYDLNRFEMVTGYYGNLNQRYADIPPSEFKQAIKDAGKKCQAFIDRTKTREVACYNCGLRCKHTYPRADGGYAYIKCQSWWSFMVSSKIIDYDFALKCFSLCEEYGLDAVAIPRCIAFAIDLYENGILTKADTDGMHLEWGNKEIILSLIDKIARREGVGDILADGIYRAARKIGKGAEKYAYHTKKVELIVSPSGFFSPYYALTQSISDRADPTRNMSYICQEIMFRPREEKEAYIKSGFSIYPKEFEKYVLSEFDWDGVDYEERCQFITYDEEIFTLTDLTGLCNFWTIFFPYPPINSRALMADLISCTTGVDFDETEITKIAKKIVALVRAYNVRTGIKRKDDTVPKIFFQRTPRPPMKKLDPNIFNKWIDKYYKLRGWNREGIPTKEILEELDLDYVKGDLIRRMII